MILRSIRVEGWRCFARPIEVGPFSDGLNIIHGPNGAGKSTLMMALARGLFDSHTVGGADIKTVQPWGRALNPKVTIEFEQGEERFRLHKQFVNATTSQLSRWEDGQYVPLAEGRAADDRARELLEGELPGRGVTDHRHWGLAQILWATQGALQIEELAASTRATIQDALGAQIAGPGSESLEAEIWEAYNKWFTPKGHLKSGASAPAIIGLKKRLEESLERRGNLQRRLDDFEAASRRIEDLQNQSVLAARDEQAIMERLEHVRQAAQDYRELLAQKKLQLQQRSSAEEQYRHLKERIEAIRQTEENRENVASELQRLQQESPAQDKLVAQHELEFAEAEKKVKETRARRQKVKAARQLAELANRYTQTKQTLDDLDRRLNQIEQTQAELNQLRESRKAIVAPDKKQLEQINQLARERDDARLRLDAALITISVQPEANIEIEVAHGQTSGMQPLSAGELYKIKGDPDVEFRIPGVGEFRGTGPTGDFGQLREHWESAAAKLNELVSGFGTHNVDTLNELHAQASEVDAQIAGTRSKLETLLDGEETDKLRHTRSRAATAITEILQEHPEWKDAPPDPIALADQARETEDQFTCDIDRHERALDQARRAQQAAALSQTKLHQEIREQKNEMARLDQRLATLRNDGLSDEQRSQKLTEIALLCDQAKGQLTQIDERMKELGQEPSKTLEVLEGQLVGLRERSNQANKELNTERGRLEQIVNEAPYSELASVDEEIDKLQDEIAAQQVQIDAARLLYETMVEQRRKLLQGIQQPIRKRANRTLQRIAGAHFDSLHFDESLLPNGISPKVTGEPVSLDRISGGEREQVHFAVRMALADVAFGNQRQLVAFDDVFTYTDTHRLARIATILDEAADRFQIVMLTCHPERYRGLPNAQFFDLEAIKNHA